MPMPPAAFSPLTTTKVGACSSRSAGSSVSSARRPVRPTTSPTNRIEVSPAMPGDAIGPGAHTSDRWRSCRTRTRRRPPGSSPCCCRAGCSSCCCRWRCSASWPCCAPPGRSCCCSSSPGLIALLLNPFVSLLRRARFPRGLAVLAVMATVILIVVGIGVPAGQPGGRPGLGVPEERAGDRRRRERVAGRLPGLAGPQRDRRAGQGARARRRCRRSARTSREGSGELVSFTSDALQILVEASIALILVIVLASTCCSTASGSARPCARSCRAATARRRTTSRRGSRPPCSATCAASCCSR